MLSFGSRNPDDRTWEHWTRDATYEQLDTPFGPMECWLELVSVGDGWVRIDGHYFSSRTRETVVASSELHFRSRAELAESLTSAGFTMQHVGIIAL